MRQRVGHVQKIGLLILSTLLKKRESLLGQQVMAVMGTGLTVAGKLQPSSVVVQILGEIVVCMVLIQVSEPAVEALVDCLSG